MDEQHSKPKAVDFDWVLVFVQLGCILFLVIAPFGFDKPSSWGLDFGHLLLVGALYGITFLWGVVLSAIKRHWSLLGAQIVAFVLVVALWLFLSLN